MDHGQIAMTTRSLDQCLPDARNSSTTDRTKDWAEISNKGGGGGGRGEGQLLLMSTNRRIVLELET